MACSPADNQQGVRRGSFLGRKYKLIKYPLSICLWLYLFSVLHPLGPSGFSLPSFVMFVFAGSVFSVITAYLIDHFDLILRLDKYVGVSLFIGLAICIVFLQTFGSYNMARDRCIMLACYLIGRFDPPWSRGHYIRRFDRLYRSGAYLFLLFWCLSSFADKVTLKHHAQERPTIKGSRLAAEVAVPIRAHVALGLSGGGYRAAIMHAGVVSALREFGIDVSHISAVSGGSIFAAYYALGGSPENFLRRFQEFSPRFPKYLAGVDHVLPLLFANVFDLPKWGWLDSYRDGRTGLHADLLDLLMFHQVTLESLKSATVRVIFCTTDLNTGRMYGFLPQGIVYREMPRRIDKMQIDYDFLSRWEFVLPSSTRSGFIPTEKGFPAKEKLSYIVAASGAFPIAFPPLERKLAKEGNPQDYLPVRLVDGGLRDNYGLNLLYDAETKVPGWALYSVILSDASALFDDRLRLYRPSENPSRALDIIYGNQGFQAGRSNARIWAPCSKSSALGGVRHNVPLIPIPSYFFDSVGFTGCSFTAASLMSFSKSSELVLAIP